MKKVLLLGGTGAMGIYLTPYLLDMGYKVDVVSLDEKTSDNAALRYMKMDAMDNEALKQLLKNEYDAIVDLLIYSDVEKTFKSRMEILLSGAAHYIYLSSYRVYANADSVITEKSPRLLDVSQDKEFLAKKNVEYSLYKAIGEDLLASSGHKNYTVIRPAITYSKFRFQLTTLEANIVIHRMTNHKTVILPEEAMNIQGTMSWAGDVAKMISRLILNRDAFGETYTVATAEHHTWREIAEYYNQIGGLDYTTVDTETFLRIWGNNNKMCEYQLKYDRFFDRVIGNSKILNATGMKQSELMGLREGLAHEIAALPKGYVWQETAVNTRMDEYLKNLK